MTNNIKKKIPEKFHIFVIIYFWQSLGFELTYLPNPNRNTDH